MTITCLVAALAAPAEFQPNRVRVEPPVPFTVRLIDEEDAQGGDSVYVIETAAGSLSRLHYGTMRRVRVGVDRWLIGRP